MKEKSELVLFVKQLKDGKACFHCWDVSSDNPLTNRMCQFVNLMLMIMQSIR